MSWGCHEMSHVKVNLSFDSRVAAMLRGQAAEQGKPVSRYLAQLIEADFRRRQDRLAEEGYRHMASEAQAFAREAQSLAGETWPTWKEEE